MSCRRLVLAAVAAGALLGAGTAAACPVCYGEAGGAVIDGTKMSVVFLGGLLYLVLGGGAGAVFALRRRVRRGAAAAHPALKLIKNESGRPRPAALEERDPR